MNANEAKLHFLQKAHDSITSANTKFAAARNNTTFTRYITLLSAIIDYANYLYYLTAARAIDVALLVNPDSSALADWQAALTAFGITLENNGVSAANGWDKDSGIRVKEAYKAVWKIINKIADTFAEEDNTVVNDNYKFKAIVQFFDSFGGTTLRIIAGNNPAPNTGVYAITTTGLISLFNQPIPLLDADLNAGRNYALHTAENLVHEFGHILDFKTQNHMYETEWQLMRNEFGGLVNCGVDANNNPILVGSLARGFGVGDGWDITKRQNQLTVANFANCSNPSDNQICQGLPIKDAVCFELEIERIADMFLFWVYSDDSSYAFYINDPEPFVSSRASALNSFANGLSWTHNNANLTPIGFIGWIMEAGNAN